MKTKIKSNIIGFKEFRESSAKYISRIENGESFTVLRRSEPIFKLSPVDDEDVWETVVDFTEIDPEGVSAKKVLQALRKRNGSN